MTTPWLDAGEDRSWRAYRRMFTLLEARLERELAEKAGISMADYTVLSNLLEAEARRWRLTELADHMKWSQSRLSHQIRRMESRGLVTREPSEEDGRGTWVVLSRAGVQTMRTAAPIHFAGVREHMIDLLTPAQLKSLALIAEKIVAHLGEATE